MDQTEAHPARLSNAHAGRTVPSLYPGCWRSRYRPGTGGAGRRRVRSSTVHLRSRAFLGAGLHLSQLSHFRGPAHRRCAVRAASWWSGQAMVRRTDRERATRRQGSRECAIYAPGRENEVRGRAAPVSRTEAVLTEEPGAAIPWVSGEAPSGGLPPPACLRADLHRRPGAAGCRPSRSGI